MAPSNISPGSAATVISFLALAGLQLETRFRVGEVLAAPRGKQAEPEPLAHHLQGEMQQLQGTVAAQQASLAQLYEVLLEPPEQHKPGQTAPGAGGATNLSNRSSGNTTMHTAAMINMTSRYRQAQQHEARHPN